MYSASHLPKPFCSAQVWRDPGATSVQVARRTARDGADGSTNVGLSGSGTVGDVTSKSAGAVRCIVYIPIACERLFERCGHFQEIPGREYNTAAKISPAVGSGAVGGSAVAGSSLPSAGEVTAAGSGSVGIEAMGTPASSVAASGSGPAMTAGYSQGRKASSNLATMLANK